MKKNCLHFTIRSKNRSQATGHMAYITRSGRHASRGDLIGTAHGNMPDWARDNPKLLWKASSEHERQNGSALRSITIGLPNVLTNEQLLEVAMGEAEHLAGSKPFELAVHKPNSSIANVPNPHVHIAICDRIPDGIDRSPEQMFKRFNPADPSKGGNRKDSGGRSPDQLKAYVRELRRDATDRINAALEKFGHALRYEHRSFRERGLKRKAERYLGPNRIRQMTEEERQAFLKARRRKR